jgi:murein DD-endopeptidase MepM/ murein hydrolase activator NlpD
LDHQPPTHGSRLRALRHHWAPRPALPRHWRIHRTLSAWRLPVRTGCHRPLRWSGERAVLALIAAVVAFLSFVVAPGWASVTREGAGSRAVAMVPLQIALPAAPVARARAPDAVAADWSRRRVERGQTLGGLFAAEGLPAALLHRILEATRYRDALTRIRPGQEFAFQRRADGSLAAFRFDAGEDRRVVVHVDAGALREQIEERGLQRRLAVASGRIEHSLFGAADAAGLSDAMVMQLANVFGYDIDFAQDLRRGDEFSLIYEEVFEEGERLRDGAILGAEFVNGGRRHVAVRFTLADGRRDYFDLDGRSLRKAFLRTPVEFSRISSRFSAGRMHPVLGRMRAHRGVDYAAPTGTPVRAAGDGKVAFRGWQGGYGNVVILEHGGRYTTLYAHLSRFAGGIRVGDRIRQGQTIGHVGMTGLATGPHLHYEFRVNGAHRDPLSLELPKSDPLAGAELQRFRVAGASMVAQLDLLSERGTVAAR